MTFRRPIIIIPQWVGLFAVAISVRFKMPRCECVVDDGKILGGNLVGSFAFDIVKKIIILKLKVTLLLTTIAIHMYIVLTSFGYIQGFFRTVLL